MSDDYVVDRPITATFSREEIIEGCRTNLDFLAMLCIPKIYTKRFPPLYHAYWQELTSGALSEEAFLRFALGLPRGFTKTVLLRLFVVWCIIYTNKCFPLICCNTQAHARNFVGRVFSMLAEPNMVKTFGAVNIHKTDRETLDLKTFSYRGRDIIMAGVGWGSSVRGMNIDDYRPDLIICDDMQSREEAENPDTAKECLDWLYGTLLKARSYSSCLVVFIGNMYPFEGSILRKLRADKYWTSLITGAILEDGESIWPEFRPVSVLLEEMEADANQGLLHIWFAEVMNDDTIGTASGYDISKIPAGIQISPDEAIAGAVVIDPSLGRKKSDAIAIGATLIIDGRPHIAHLEELKVNPHALMMAAIQLAQRFGLRAICIEANSSQEYLRLWFVSVVAQLGITGLEILPLDPKGVSKVARIRAAVKLWFDDKISTDPSVRTKLVYQLAQWRPLKANPVDDLLDILAYSTIIHLEYPDQIMRPLEVVAHEVSDDLVLPW